MTDEGYEELRVYIEQVLAGQEVTFESQVPYREGGTRYISATYVPRFSNQGTVEGFVALVNDISERKQAEAALRQSESRLRLIVESAKEYAIFSLDLDGTITSWNSGAERLLGYPETEIIGCNDQILYTAEDNEQGRAKREIETVLAQGRAENECWHVRRDGNRFWGSGFVMPLYNEAGSIQGFVKVLRDMTESRLIAEREQFLAEASSILATSIDYKTTLFNIARLAVPFLADYCFFDVINANNQIERVAWHHVDATKQAWFDQIQQFVPLQSIKKHPVADVMLNGNTKFVPEVTDEWMQKIAISEQHLQFIRECQFRSLITTPLIVNQRKLGALTFCFTTISERRYTQDDLAVAEELAHRAALALDNARLYQQAQEANRIKDEFLAVLSHELRSPLNPILGWARLLRTGRLDETKTAQALATIERNAKLQTELIEDLLDVSRILQGKLSLNIAPVHLSPVIQAAMETVQLAAEAKGITLETSLDSGNEQVLGDPNRLQQIVWNLLSNAVKFSSEGSRVQVQLSYGGNQAQIVVNDTGKGIHPDFLPHVFDYFRQADSATTRRFGGLGLGLAIVRHLVELHGGTIQAKSPGEGLGASFTVRLPLIQLGSNYQPETGTTSLLPSAAYLAGCHILVVDDDTDTRDFVVVLLEQAGARVTAASSSTEALAAFTQTPPDLLLSDIGIPDIDGYMLIRQIRTFPSAQGGQIPAIALTAYAGDFNQQQALQAGFQRHLAKPVEPNELLITIAALLGLS